MKALLKQWAFMGTVYMEYNGTSYNEAEINVESIQNYVKVRNQPIMRRVKMNIN